MQLYFTDGRAVVDRGEQLRCWNDQLRRKGDRDWGNVGHDGSERSQWISGRRGVLEPDQPELERGDRQRWFWIGRLHRLPFWRANRNDGGHELFEHGIVSQQHLLLHGSGV